MKLANTENVNLFQDIYQYIPTDRFAALKIFDNLLHIIHKSMFKQKFSSNIKIWFLVILYVLFTGFILKF